LSVGDPGPALEQVLESGERGGESRYPRDIKEGGDKKNPSCLKTEGGSFMVETRRQGTPLFRRSDGGGKELAVAFGEGSPDKRLVALVCGGVFPLSNASYKKKNLCDGQN
jgi:hypothetical protein